MSSVTPEGIFGASTTTTGGEALIDNEQYYAKLELIDNEIFANNVPEAILWDNASSLSENIGSGVAIDSDVWYDVIVQEPLAGRPVSVTLHCTWDTNTTGARFIQIYHFSNADVVLSNPYIVTQADAVGALGISHQAQLFCVPDEGDYFRAVLQQDSGGNRTLLGASTFMVVKSP